MTNPKVGPQLPVVQSYDLQLGSSGGIEPALQRTASQIVPDIFIPDKPISAIEHSTDHTRQAFLERNPTKQMNKLLPNRVVIKKYMQRFENISDKFWGQSLKNYTPRSKGSYRIELKESQQIYHALVVIRELRNMVVYEEFQELYFHITELIRFVPYEQGIGSSSEFIVDQYRKIVTLYTQIKTAAAELLLDYLERNWLESEDVYLFFKELSQQPEMIASEKERQFARKYMKILEAKYDV